jgi:hypothetical protein
MNKLLLFLALACTTLVSFAQTSIGIKGGINLNNIKVKAPSNVKYEIGQSMGFHVGAFFIPKTDGLTTFVTELQFSQRGYKEKSGDDETIKLSYLECSFLFSYWPVKQLGIDIGPSFSCLLSAKMEGKDIDNIYDTPLDIGVKAGIRGYVSPRLSLIAHYYYGLTNIDEVKMSNISIKEYNRVISLGVGMIVNKVHN